MRSALLCASSAEKIFESSNAGRSADCPALHFHGRTWTANSSAEGYPLSQSLTAFPDFPFCRCVTSSSGAGEVVPLRGSPWHSGKVFGSGAKFPVSPPLPLGELPPQRLRGCRWRTEKKSLSEAARFFPARLPLWGLKGASSPFLVAGWAESRGREGGVETPLPASGPAERPSTLAAGRNFPRSTAARQWRDGRFKMRAALLCASSAEGLGR